MPSVARDIIKKIEFEKKFDHGFKFGPDVWPAIADIIYMYERGALYTFR